MTPQATLRWGFTPSLSGDGKPGPTNARAEAAAAKPMFRTGLRRFRCLIPADGLYERRKEPGGAKTVSDGHVMRVRGRPTGCGHREAAVHARSVGAGQAATG